jgi:ribosomal protein S18 acetylase RimI-like enzyme
MNPSIRLVQLAPEHALDAARLHIAGQPGTFLTRLGPEVMTAFYRALPRSAHGFGLAALGASDNSAQMVGFVSATTSTASLFAEMGTRRAADLAPALLRRALVDPGVVVQGAQTVAYPFLARGTSSQQAGAELLSIMVESEWRSSGVGSRLLHGLLAECNRRGIGNIHVTVDEANPGARRFYERHGFALERTFVLYGRTMCLYARSTGGGSA